MGVNVGVGVGVGEAPVVVVTVVVDFAVVGVVEVDGSGAIDRATRVAGAALEVVGVGVAVGVAVSVGVGVGVGVGHPAGMVSVGVGVGVAVSVGVEVGVGDHVGQITEVESVGNGSVALGEFSLGSGRALVGDPVGVVIGSGLGFAEELGRLVGSGTGTGLIGRKLWVAESLGSVVVVEGAGLRLIEGTLAVWP